MLRRFLASFCVWLALCAPALCAVALDAKSTTVSDSADNVTSSTHTNLTIVSGNALTCIATFDTKTVSGITLTWDSGGTNQAMTSLGTPSVGGGTFGVIALFGRLAPTSGNKTLAASWTGNAQVSLYCMSWTGVDQTSIAVAFPHYNPQAATSGTASVVITSAANNAVFAAFATPITSFTSPTQTELYNWLAMTNLNTGAQRAAGGGPSVTIQYSVGASDTWVAAGVDILASGAAAACPVSRSLTGAGC